jgi:hypothetical protein
MYPGNLCAGVSLLFCFVSPSDYAKELLSNMGSSGNTYIYSKIFSCYLEASYFSKGQPAISIENYRPLFFIVPVFYS